MKKTFFFLAFGLYCSQINAAGGYEHCLDNSQGVSTKISDCIAKDMEAQDSRLNSAYKKLMAQQRNEARKKELKNSQKIWLSLRTADCDFKANQDGGTAEDLVRRECYREATEQRASMLENLLTSP
ncbi:MAG: lysozyme inhibitor LprI family protein [Pseudomonadota bacterium]|nr:lysozyme inhibitor LprI family protein [Pseudomonadota bacterium]